MRPDVLLSLVIQSGDGIVEQVNIGDAVHGSGESNTLTLAT